MESEKSETSLTSNTQDPYNHYKLSECVYDRLFVFQDIFPENNRPVRYDRYSHRNIYDDLSGLPVWADFLKNQKYDDVWKAFKLFGLDDCERKTDAAYGGIVNQFFRSIDLYLTNTNRDTLHCVFKQARAETLDVKNVLANTNISFSAHPWDIATMSMRGITSCMSWHNGHAKQLAGSILDPYCAIIALTNNTIHRGQVLSYGKRMVARSVVRLVKSNKNKNYKLLLEKIYTVEKNPVGAKLSIIQQAFRNYLSSKTSLPIIDSSQIGNNVIPYFADLPSLPENTRSYRDSHIEYEAKEDS